MFFKKKKETIDMSRLPTHVSFIMDGNGRWAKKRGLPRTFGHKIGVESFIETVRHAHELGIKIVSFYAFSTENWNREKSEVDEIFRLCKEGIKDKKQSFIEKNMKLKVIGFKDKLPKDLVKQIEEVEDLTKDNTGLLVLIALNYGGRAEIVEAVNKILASGKKHVTEEEFKSFMQTNGIPDPDLVVRTSGERRLSNFMMYEVAYSELYFPQIHWPDFREKAFDEAIIDYQKRDRRFGGIKKA